MKYLVLLRGAPGSGKSTFVEEYEMGQYTLCPDNLRLLFQSPIMFPDGTMRISQDNDNKVWGLLFQVLEDRMERGEFTIIDATHSKDRDFTKYKKLVQRYRYRCICVDFTDVPIDVCKKRNVNRPKHKFVPEDVIDNMYARFETFNPLAWVKVIKPEQFQDEVRRFPPLDLTGAYRRIHFIGDLHGCYTALKDYLGEDMTLKSEELYIFVGDFVDRGQENAELVKYLISIRDAPNVMMIEGNHEIHLWRYALGEEGKSREFNKVTQLQLEEAGIEKKDLRKLFRRFIQIAYVKYHDKYVVVTHGGISMIPVNEVKSVTNVIGLKEIHMDYNDFKFIANNQLIKGPGKYEDARETDDTFMASMPSNFYSVHGHRNVEGLPTRVNDQCFNLEGSIEFGGDLRVAILERWGDKTRWRIREVKNTVFKPPPQRVDTKLIARNVEELVQVLSSYPDHIKVYKVNDSISSFNFKGRVFYDRIWNEMTTKARGLFINTNTNKIVVRSYNKFFNLGERPETQFSVLKNQMKFPAKAYLKYNGYLGMMGYDEETDEIVTTSKSRTEGPFADWFRKILMAETPMRFPDHYEKVKKFLKDRNVAFIFEVIDPRHDPHIIKHEGSELILLDIVHRTMDFKKEDYPMVGHYAHQFGFKFKEPAKTLESWDEFHKWYIEIQKPEYRFYPNSTIQVEGFVIEDADGHMCKIKLPYYNLWKFMRSLKERVAKGKADTVRRGALTTPVHNLFFKWMTEQEPSYLLKTDIIQLRDAFFNDMKKRKDFRKLKVWW